MSGVIADREQNGHCLAAHWPFMGSNGPCAHAGIRTLYIDNYRNERKSATSIVLIMLMTRVLMMLNGPLGPDYTEIRTFVH